jgi:hypothetical protein
MTIRIKLSYFLVRFFALIPHIFAWRVWSLARAVHLYVLGKMTWLLMDLWNHSDIKIYYDIGASVALEARGNTAKTSWRLMQFEDGQAQT